jgi:hypothetical protein
MTFRFSLASLLILFTAFPLWTFLIVMVGSSPGFRGSGLAVAPIALVVATAAIFRLLRGRANALPWAALIAGVVLTGAILVVAAVARME